MFLNKPVPGIIAGMFVLYGEQYAQILEQFGEACGMGADEVANETAEVRKTIAEVREATLTAGWDGAWFRRAYDANGNPVGTNEDSEGKIYIEPQGMCVMAGIGVDDGKAAKALESTKELLTCRWGTAILAPAYSTYRIELGEISSYPRGYKENGGIFCHNNPWISIANAKINNNDEAFNVYKRTCPAYTEEYSEIHRTEPYVYCQMVAGPEAGRGQEQLAHRHRGMDLRRRLPASARRAAHIRRPEDRAAPAAQLRRAAYRAHMAWHTVHH